MHAYDNSTSSSAPDDAPGSTPENMGRPETGVRFKQEPVSQATPVQVRQTQGGQPITPRAQRDSRKTRRCVNEKCWYCNCMTPEGDDKPLCGALRMSKHVCNAPRLVRRAVIYLGCAGTDR